MGSTRSPGHTQGPAGSRLAAATIGAVAVVAAMFLQSDDFADAQFGLKTIYVDRQDAHAADDNPGTASLPLLTLGRAIALASEANANTIPVRIIVRPGVYRESLRIAPDGETAPAPITIEGTAGGVLLSG